MKTSTKPAPLGGRITDALVFLSNVGFLLIFDSLLRKNSVLSSFFGWLTVATFFLYPIGAYLKKPHVQNRLRLQNPNGTKLPWWFSPLVFFQFLIFVFIINISLNLTGLLVFREDYSPWYIILTLIMFVILPIIPPIITSDAISYSETPHEYAPWRLKRFTEIIGDILLTFSIIVFSAHWGALLANGILEPGERGILARGDILEILGGVIAFIVILLPFAMFYLAPRILYLAEDYRKPSTWVMIFIALSPLVAGIFF